MEKEKRPTLTAHRRAPLPPPGKSILKRQPGPGPVVPQPTGIQPQQLQQQQQQQQQQEQQQQEVIKVEKLIKNYKLC